MAQTQPRPQRVVLVTGAAPYLGGAATWAPLKAAAPEFDFFAVDLLAIAGAPDLDIEQRKLLTQALSGASAIVAHGAAAKGAIEAVAAVDPALPAILISPLLVTQATPALAAMRAAARFGAAVFDRMAATKLERLRREPAYVREQLAFLVLPSAISDELICEAMQRIADPRTRDASKRTAEVLRSLLRPLDAAVDALVWNRIVVVGDCALDRKLRRRMACVTIEGAGSAAMLETPRAVAAHLRTSCGLS